LTLLEVVLATMVLAVGVLAVASSAEPAARMVRWGGVQSAAAAAAAARVETLRSDGCASLRSGEAQLAGGLRLRWIADSAGRWRAVTVRATYPWASGERTEAFETAVACVP
jgi:hypothetical protein